MRARSGDGRTEGQKEGRTKIEGWKDGRMEGQKEMASRGVAAQIIWLACALVNIGAKVDPLCSKVGAARRKGAPGLVRREGRELARGGR